MTVGTRLTTWSSWLVATIITVALLPVLDVTAAAPQAGALRSFYIATGASFGNLSRQIVSVEPIGRDVRIRAIRVAAVNEYCPRIQLVTAAERLVRGATVQAVARIPICDVSQGTIDRALARSKTPPVHYIDYMGGGQTVVANCDGHERVLNLEDNPPWLNFETLERTAPQVSALFNMSELSAGMLANPWIIDPEQEALGTSLLPELRSTKYAAAFGEDLVQTLKGYEGPPAQRDLLPVELLERDALPLITFVAPVFPPIALSARMSGDVRLRLTLDPETGTVSQVERLADKPILGDAAVQAVRSWRFDPAKAPREPIDVTLRFQMRCSND